MNPPDLHTVLAKLITLTKERDVSILECSLLDLLADLVLPQHSEHAALAAVTSSQAAAAMMYRAADTDKRLFTLVASNPAAKPGVLSEVHTIALARCFEGGAPALSVHGQTRLGFYPLKNSKQQTTAVIVLQHALDCTNGDSSSPAYTASSELEQQFDEVVMMLLQIYQNFTGLINDNERDTLTGLLNRKSFEHKINKVLARLIKDSQRKHDQFKQHCFLAIFDIDHFKRVNDEFGHLMGDEVLLLFSQLMTTCFRDEDILFRFGGEEFLGVFECAGIENIQAILERFREKVASFSFPQIGRITASAGFTEVHAYDAPSQLIDNADLALYYAKNNGRNRICQYEYLLAQGELQESKKEGDVELF